ncbi:MAG: hypothetical protein ACXWC4_00695 [Telluria sp.]
MTPEEALHDLKKYNFPRVYHTRLVAFGTPETDEGAVIAVSKPVDSLTTNDELLKFLHRIWGLTSTALDRREHHADHKPALVQLELELPNLVMTLRGQAITRTCVSEEKYDFTNK